MDSRGTMNVYQQETKQYVQQMNEITKQHLNLFPFSDTKPQEKNEPHKYGEANVQKIRAYYQFHRYV